jgi:cellulose synthase/poly-beta-1,6-N-acetylglucosamine synthase-like glycosyltransferase
LIISAYNEQEVISEKLQNSLQLDYDAEKLEIIVVSDASDDLTDNIVASFYDSGVKLVRMTERLGKTAGLNKAVSNATGEIIVFSDANALYNESAIKMLVRNFEQIDVGCVVGESKYSDSKSDAEKSESLYWRYETLIKKLESDTGSVVGGDGAIYAIRHNLYQEMPDDALSDFVNPLQIISQGKRCIYEPEAFSTEAAAGSYFKEYRRKVRIVNRAWRSLMSMKFLLNPIRFGFFSWKLISHKLLRWLVPFFLCGAFTANIVLVFHDRIYILVFALQCLFYSLAIAGLLSQRRSLPACIFVPYYFCLVNLASAKGIVEAYQGKTYATWSTARARNTET